MSQVLTPAFADQRRVNEKRQCLHVALLCKNGDFFSLAYQNANVYHFLNPEQKARRRTAASVTPPMELLIFQTTQEEVFIRGHELRDYAVGMSNRTLALLAETGTVSAKPKYPDSEKDNENAPYIASIQVRNRP